MNRLLELYRTLYHTAPLTTEAITGSGSSRQYYRLGDAEHTVIGTIGTSLEENSAFLGLTRHFEQCGLPVPHILAVSSDSMAYLQTDLGTTSLYQAISEGRQSGTYSAAHKELLQAAVALLPRFQILGAEHLDTSLCYPTPRMDETTIHFDLNYFKYCYLKLLPGIDFNELNLQQDFNRLCHDLLALIDDSRPTLILRDFQARNIILRPTASGTSAPCLIDYQGCRMGPAEYDLASFLWQASARYPSALREELIDTYVRSANELRPTDAHEVRQRLRLMVLFRLLQVLGAYGFCGLYERKAYFLNSIPFALASLKELLTSGIASPYPYLQQILKQICDCQITDNKSSRFKVQGSNPDAQISNLTSNGMPTSPSKRGPLWGNSKRSSSQSEGVAQRPGAYDEISNFKSQISNPTSTGVADSPSKIEGVPLAAGAYDKISNLSCRRVSQISNLTVTITSFSYKRGLPSDPSGNGGGYIFDCRSTHNPGRYEQYKHLTGLDSEVIRFLEDDGEILEFLSHVYPLVDHHVKRFVARNFTSLTVSFGCTGGQHRSVYCAEHLAAHLREQYPMVQVRLIHREQPNWPTGPLIDTPGAHH